MKRKRKTKKEEGGSRTDPSPGSVSKIRALDVDMGESLLGLVVEVVFTLGWWLLFCVQV